MGNREQGKLSRARPIQFYLCYCMLLWIRYKSLLKFRACCEALGT